MAQPMVHVNQRPAARLRLRACLTRPLPRAAHDERLQRLADWPAQQFRTRVPGDSLSSPVPEHHSALKAGQCNALRETVQRGRQQFRQIGHPNLFISYIGTGKTNFIAFRRREKIGICTWKQGSAMGTGRIDYPNKHSVPDRRSFARCIRIEPKSDWTSRSEEHTSEL